MSEAIQHQPSARQPQVGQPFALRPFETTACCADLGLTGKVERRGQGPGAQLLLQYELRANSPEVLAAVHWPLARATPERCDELWTSTCCEAFLAVAGDEAYWELNVSPAGDWNLYRLSGYRQNLTPDPGLKALPIQINRLRDGWQLTVNLPLGPLGLGPLGLGPAGLAAMPLDLGITAVLEHRGGALSYWALTHPAPEADFHHRGGFQLRLDP